MINQNHIQFIAKLENNVEPLVSFKDLIIEISNYTNKTPSQIADKLETLLFDFRTNNKYINAFCYCTIIDRINGDDFIYHPMSNYFKDNFDYIKRYLKEVVLSNSLELEDENLDKLFTRRAEIAQRIKLSRTPLLDKLEEKAPTLTPQISQSQSLNDYISLYDFIEWAKDNYSDYTATANDIINLLNGKDIQLYKRYDGIKPRIAKAECKLKSALDFIAQHNGYDDPLDELWF